MVRAAIESALLLTLKEAEAEDYFDYSNMNDHVPGGVLTKESNKGGRGEADGRRLVLVSRVRYYGGSLPPQKFVEISLGLYKRSRQTNSVLISTECLSVKLTAHAISNLAGNTVHSQIHS